MTDKELLEKAAHRFRLIADDTNRITSGNLSHNLTCLRGFALRAAESIEKHLQEEPVSEDLEEAADNALNNVLNTHEIVNVRSCLEMFRLGAKWQKKQMMKDASDVTVHIDAGGYPYIPQMELYDYDNDVSLAKEGDKYKVVLIKEE